VYATLLGVVAMAFVTGLLVRVPLKVDIIRDRGTLARETPDGRVENVYRFQVMNTDDRPHQYVIAVTGLPGGEVSTARPVELGPASARMIPVEVRGDPHGLKRGSNPVRFSVQAVDDAKIRVEEKSVFFMR
jgi:polyferredoxin